MADISLKDYLDKVYTLFKARKYDEVVQHGRHILTVYPRNGAAILLLGQALVQTSDLDQAESVLRRALAIYPNDPVAHSNLAEANERQGKSETAIWHLERALEQDPSNTGYLDSLRNLYGEYRGIENPRFQLTTGAVARQYIRNGLYTQAIDTLQGTLQKSPRRVDLRLHLAQTMWEAGMRVEAAEVALDVLNALPYCLEANRIMTLLWLAEERPSDAQRYLNQIQEVDPYLALQLAQGGPPPDDAFILPELDYRRMAEAQVAAQRPDWLEKIDTSELEYPEGVSPDEAVTQPRKPPTGPLPTPTSSTTSGRSGMTGLLAALDSDEEEEALEPAEIDFLDEEAEDLFAGIDLGAEDEASELELPALEAPGDSDELPDFFAELDTETDLAEDEPLDWMQQDEQAVDEELPDGLEFQGLGEEDPLAWMEGTGVELSEEAEPTAALEDDEIEFQNPDEADPLAWLQGTGVELSDEAEEEEELPVAEPDADDPLAWLQGSDEEETEAGAPEAQGTDFLNVEAIELAPDLFADEGDDSLEWVEDSETAEEVELAGPLPSSELD